MNTMDVSAGEWCRYHAAEYRRQHKDGPGAGDDELLVSF